MKKITLIDYKYVGMFPFGDGEFYTSYNLKLKVSYFWGIFSKIKAIPYEVTMFQSVDNCELHWDYLIETQKPIQV